MAILTAEPTKPTAPQDHLGATIDLAAVAAYRPSTKIDVSTATDIYNNVNTAPSDRHIRAPAGRYSQATWQWTSVANRTSWTYLTPNDAGQSTLNSNVPFGYRVDESHKNLLVHLDATDTGTGTKFILGSSTATTTPNEERYIYFCGVWFGASKQSNTTFSFELFRNHACIVIFDRCLFAREYENFLSSGNCMTYTGFKQIFIGCTFTGCAVNAIGTDNQSFLMNMRPTQLAQHNCLFGEAVENWYIAGSPTPDLNKSPQDIELSGCQMGHGRHGKYDWRGQNTPKTCYTYSLADRGTTTVSTVPGAWASAPVVTVASAPAGTQAGDLFSVESGSAQGARLITNVSGNNITLDDSVNGYQVALPSSWASETVRIYPSGTRRNWGKAGMEIKHRPQRMWMHDCVVWGEIGGDGNLIRMTPVTSGAGNGGAYGFLTDLLFERVLFKDSLDEMQIFWYLNLWGSAASPELDNDLGSRRVLFRDCVIYNAKGIPASSTSGDDNISCQFNKNGSFNPNKVDADCGWEHCVTYYDNPAKIQSGIWFLGGGGTGGATTAAPGPLSYANCIIQCNNNALVQPQDMSGVSNGQQAIDTRWQSWFFEGNIGINASSGSISSWTIPTKPPKSVSLAAIDYADPVNHDFTCNGTEHLNYGTDGQGGDVDSGLTDPALFRDNINAVLLGQPINQTNPPLVINPLPSVGVGEVVDPTVPTPQQSKLLILFK